MNSRWRIMVGVLVALAMTAVPVIAADKVYEKPSTFLARHFDKVPKTKVLDLDKQAELALSQILGHGYESQRVRYWKSGEKVAWILNEVGKTEPITVGFIVRDGKIVEVKVLIYRESHGWEVSRPFFTRQFVGASLQKDQSLDCSVDGIVGATLSVRALTQLSMAALYLSEQVK